MDYTKSTASVIINVADKDGKPVDGAKVALWCNPGPYGAGWVSNIAYLFTDFTGTIKATVGAGKAYAYQVYHLDFGYLPSSTHATVLNSGLTAVKNQTYTTTVNFTDKTMPVIQINNQLTVPVTANYGVHLNFEAKDILIGTYADVDQSEFGHFDTVGITSVFICDSINYQKYSTNQSFDAYQVNLHVASGNMQIPLPAEGKWYVILSNDLLKSNYQNINAQCELTGIKKSSPSNEIRAYPNPFKEKILIELPEGFEKGQILDIMGRIMTEFNGENYTWKPDEAIMTGVYIIKAWKSKKIIQKKLYYVSYWD